MTVLGIVPAACLGLAPSARAMPLFFEGPSGFGFDPADAGVLSVPLVLTVDGSWSWETAGAPAFSPVLQVTTSLLGLIGPEPMPPSFATPLLASVQYTVTNTTGSVLDGALLVFTRGAVDGPSTSDPDPWPFLEPEEFGLDSAGLVRVAAAPYAFGAVVLPTLAPGAVHGFTQVHVVADDLGGTVIPSPGLALLRQTAVPEPGALVLLAVGLAALRLRHAAR